MDICLHHVANGIENEPVALQRPKVTERLGCNVDPEVAKPGLGTGMTGVKVAFINNLEMLGA